MDGNEARVASEPSEDDIVDSIFDAVVEQRLPPGTKLSEAALCEAFGVGRMRIRQALLLLDSREVVELQPGRGAFVASPTPQQAQEVFEARLTLEPALARLAVERATGADIAALDEHLRIEAEAHRDGQRHVAIRLSGEFHILLAEAAGNATLVRVVRDLVTRTSLILGCFAQSGVQTCRDADHREILTAIESRDADRAARLMVEHLGHIQSALDFSRPVSSRADLVTLLRRQPVA